LYGFQLCEEAADQMTTLPATNIGLSETHKLEFETQKSERETLVVLKGKVGLADFRLPTSLMGHLL
jgi:hypothetical protein